MSFIKNFRPAGNFQHTKTLGTRQARYHAINFELSTGEEVLTSFGFRDDLSSKLFESFER
jgi:hypothetical protein